MAPFCPKAQCSGWLMVEGRGEREAEGLDGRSRIRQERKGREGRQGRRVNKEGEAIKWEICWWEIEESKYKLDEII